ncbi:TrmB family transcriptional regulator [Mesorhizobium sp. YM1C-6-2]|uniref:TrmB family transcriptional regulator n=1 Tax=Mesorhizobium sp. YM1C-6-2 TaxID=1827501 RepID=UPI000EF1CE2A|nr:TrmB family transcriptional regulator [Mesorhizobium sp. YM1C-6-2]RLP24040.1 transcriptional regulator [Mesorhizobium sp. YM1C-6-2]
MSGATKTSEAKRLPTQKPDPIATSDIVSELQGLGFSDYEARSYLGLLTSSPATAYDVSKTMGIPRANVYGALENLMKKGAVQPVGERPARFVPVPPAELLGSIVKKTSNRCERLATLLEKVETEQQQEVVWTIKGEDLVNIRIGDMLDRAQKHIWIKAADHILEAHRDRLKAAHDRGVRIVIILFGTDVERFSFGNGARVYLHEGNGIRIGSADNIFTLTIDYTEAITARMKDDYLGAHTRSEPVVTMAETIIRHDIYLAEIYSRFGKEIEGAFGPYLVQIRESLFSGPQAAQMRERLRDLGLLGKETKVRAKAR